MKKKTIKKHKLYDDCISLDHAFLDWLRERLPFYLKSAEKFIDFEHDHMYTYKDKQYKQNELVRIMIKDLDIANMYDLMDTEYLNAVDEILDIWKLVFHAMWW